MSRADGYLLPERMLDAEHIIREVARGFRVTVDEILGPGCEKRITVARACAMATVRAATTMSYPEIGYLFDRHHTTVMSAVAKIMGDPDLRRGVELVVEELSPPPRLFAVPDDHHEEAV